MKAIKTWFLQKNEIMGFYGNELRIAKETEKAVLVETFINGRKYTQWVPKTCMIDEWEKDTSNFGYHDYLVETYHKAYEDQRIKNFTINSGYNRYRGDNFIHQLTTKELMESLDRYNIDYMTRKEWNAR